MKEGLCEAVAPEKSTACGEGPPSERIAEKAAIFLLDTGIDLAGNPCPQRLTMDAQQLMVSNLVGNRRPECRREWRWEQVEAFRVEPAVGSHFLQAQVAGQWIDVLRRPGDVTREVTDVVGRLNAHGHHVGHHVPMVVVGQERGAGSGERGARSRTPCSKLPAPCSPPARLRMSARLWALLRPFRGSVVLLLVLSLGAVAIDMTPPVLLQVLVDRVLQADRRNTPWDSCCNSCWPSLRACCWPGWLPRWWPFGRDGFPVAWARR